MKFIMEQLDHNYYFIMINYQIVHDSDISEKLKIPLKEYQNCLLKFNGFKYFQDVYFCDKLDCQNALDYLNEKYGVLLALLEV